VKHCIFGDTHIHDFRQFGSGEGSGSTRFRTCIRVVNEIREFCVTQGINSAIHLGDVFEARRTAQYPLFNATVDVFRQFSLDGIRLRILVGNHDEVDKKGKDLTIHAFRTFAEVYDENTLKVGFEDPNSRSDYFAFVPYTADTDSVLKFLDEMPDDAVIFGHWDVLGSEAGSSEWSTERGLERAALHRFKRVFLGHIHQKQALGERAHYIGATAARNIEERDQLGWFVAYDDNTNEIEWHNTSAPVFRLLDPQKYYTTDYFQNAYVKILSEPCERIDNFMKTWGAVAWVYSPEVVAKPKILQRDSGISLTQSHEKLVELYASLHHGDLPIDHVVEVGKELLIE
jgi:DNA repair exonuclease SbcCD nuclease subunit